jgi:hypothetical protein
MPLDQRLGGVAVKCVVVLSFVVSLGSSEAVSAQSAPASQSGHALEVGAQITSTRISELDTNDVGFGGRLSWFPTPFIGVEGELNLFAADIPDRPAVTRGRLEALFGVTAGPRMNWWRPFARARAGVLRVDSAPQPIACIQIFPPPLQCALAGGDSLVAIDLGGGFEVFTSAKTFVRFDLGDRMLRYSGPALDRNGGVHDGAFIDHDLRATIGGGWRF